jgi:hypothetical protein
MTFHFQAEAPSRWRETSRSTTVMRIDTAWLKSAALAVAMAAVAGAAQAAVVVGGFGGPRTLSGDDYSIYGTNSGARAEMLNPANHALYGDTITFAASTTTASAAYLSGVDVFFTGLINRNANALSSAEVTALGNFIAGGGVVIAHGDNTLFEQTVNGLLNLYGLNVVSTSNSSSTVNIDNALHPVMSGPFGAVGAHLVQDSARLDSVSLGDGQVIASYATGGFGAVAVVNPGPGRLGALLFLPDSETYGLSQLNFRSQDEARRLFNNGVAWAVNIANTPQNTVPEPTTLALVGLALAGIAARARRR